MLKHWMILVLFVVAVGFTEDSRLKEARTLVAQFMTTLKGELLAGMAEGGPEKAIAVCSERAPRVAATLASNTTWSVARTSLKPRHAENLPDAWEAKVLRAFEHQVNKGADPTALEFAEVVQGEYRYMKAIPTAELCLTCHGTALSAPLKQKIQALYPQDQAVGYAVGELRGAFSLRSRKTER